MEGSRNIYTVSGSRDLETVRGSSNGAEFSCSRDTWDTSLNLFLSAPSGTVFFNFGNTCAGRYSLHLETDRVQSACGFSLA